MREPFTGEEPILDPHAREIAIHLDDGVGEPLVEHEVAGAEPTEPIQASMASTRMPFADTDCNVAPDTNAARIDAVSRVRIPSNSPVTTA